ncbi:GSCFA domain-containing protein [Prevotella sp. P4-119]|uniref:GSCFA domain-containing protein n=1 Tax=Prevotella sp. P4-119 TaxID=2024218 RepID=UPI000B96DBE3|nr:GSCFA domain-containing protein [Prevotella sp. P4-119]OYP45230.1 GSCFA family protein [Prevotella sp. P4-119]
MDFRTPVTITEPSFRIEPLEQILFVGSCFADNIGQRFVENKFRATVNPYGVMYNPVSILHTVMRTSDTFPVAFFTLGTNHVYRLKETGEIVDNCEKRPHHLFQEETLTVSRCANYLRQAIALLQSRSADVEVVLTVSPIRYRKYGYHGSQLSKATLLLAADEVAKMPNVHYFPAYEIVNDELRDYRFYAADMLHPSEQAVDYIWERLCETYLSDRARQFLSEWQPVKQALGHKPFAPESEAYRTFMNKTMLKVEELRKKYGNFAL